MKKILNITHIKHIIVSHEQLSTKQPLNDDEMDIFPLKVNHHDYLIFSASMRKKVFRLHSLCSTIEGEIILSNFWRLPYH